MDDLDASKKFFLIVDNGDGTCTGRLSFGDGEIFNAVMTMSFDDYMSAMMQDAGVRSAGENLTDNIIPIPNQPD